MEQAREVAGIADGVVVGSQLVKTLEQSMDAFKTLAKDLNKAIKI